MNQEAPRVVLLSETEDGSQDEYGAKLAMWQYRVGKGFLMQASNHNESEGLRKLTSLPGVQTLAFEKPCWTLNARENHSPSVLITNISETAKAVHKRLCREHESTPAWEMSQEEEEAKPLLQAVVQGCKDALRRKQMVTSPTQSKRTPLDGASKAVVNRGRNLG